MPAALLKSRRSLFVASVTSTALLVVYSYYTGAVPDLRDGVNAGLQVFLSNPSIAARPAWIDVPDEFNVSQIPLFLPAQVAPNRDLRLHPLLAQAMLKFLRRPVLTHDQAREQNEAACPVEQLNSQVNHDQHQSDGEKWLEVGPDKIVEMRQAALAYLEARSDKEGIDALMGPGRDVNGHKIVNGSRGVVLAAGNHNTTARAINCIKELQKLGWESGSIELFHFEGELTDKGHRKELAALGVAVRKVPLDKTEHHWKNFEIKAEAILRSSFDEVLFLDSDNFPLADVRAHVFDAPLFTDPRGGRAVFWPDLNRDHPNNAVHRLLGVPCHDSWGTDSGQLAIAKSGNGGLNLAALYLAQHMAASKEDPGYWFSNGDRDTFRYAFLALGLTYTPAPRWLSLLGRRDSEHLDEPFCGTAMLQYGLDPPSLAHEHHPEPRDAAHPLPLFVHANLMKHQFSQQHGGGVFSRLRRLVPDQDDMRAQYQPGTGLNGVRGGGGPVAGKGLCSDIVAFRPGVKVETVDTKTAFGGFMAGLEDNFLAYDGNQLGEWR